MNRRSFLHGLALAPVAALAARAGLAPAAALAPTAAWGDVHVFDCEPFTVSNTVFATNTPPSVSEAGDIFIDDTLRLWRRSADGWSSVGQL